MPEAVQQVRCPVCGTPGTPGDFCEMGCGRLPAAPATAGTGAKREASSEAQTRAPTSQNRGEEPAGTGSHGAEGGWTAPTPKADLEMEWDAMCLLFEGLTGLLRFRVTAGRRLENLVLTVENPLTGEKRPSRRVASLEEGEKREVPVAVPPQEAGGGVWYLTATYETDGRVRAMEGELERLVKKPQEAQMAAKNLSVQITNNITNGNASDVTVSQRTLEDLAPLAQSENPFDALQKLVRGGQREWTKMGLWRGGAQEALPPLPAGTATDRLMLELGTGKLHLRTKRTITLGRSRETCEITLRPAPEATDEIKQSYLLLSRRHCQFEAKGKQVIVRDGYRDGIRGTSPSMSGTYWNGERIGETRALEAGEEGMLSFSRFPRPGDGRSFAAKACHPCGQCGTCTKTDRAWCGGGEHACLLLWRRGMAEAYVAMWGCFPLAEADPAFEGVVLFRERGGFAWRRGRRCG